MERNQEPGSRDLAVKGRSPSRNGPAVDQPRGRISLSSFRQTAALLALLAGAAGSATAQQPSRDSAHSEIRRTLRAFYFTLAHGDWEAMTAYILAAKVVAHRVPPEAMTMSAGGSASPVDANAGCTAETNGVVDRATIKLDAEWAEVLVPRCRSPAGGGDQFRLIRFEGRWRFLHIDLFDRPSDLSKQP
jgi:hypothetical protein